MNMRMLKTELYKIYSKRVIWIAMIVFLGLFLVLKLQFIENVGVKHTLEPMRSSALVGVLYFLSSFGIIQSILV